MTTTVQLLSGPQLRMSRSCLNLTLKQLSELTSVSESTLKRVEKNPGNINDMRVDNLCQLTAQIINLLEAAGWELREGGVCRSE